MEAVQAYLDWQYAPVASLAIGALLAWLLKGAIERSRWNKHYPQLQQIADLNSVLEFHPKRKGAKTYEYTLKTPDSGDFTVKVKHNLATGALEYTRSKGSTVSHKLPRKNWQADFEDFLSEKIAPNVREDVARRQALAEKRAQRGGRGIRLPSGQRPAGTPKPPKEPKLKRDRKPKPEGSGIGGKLKLKRRPQNETKTTEVVAEEINEPLFAGPTIEPEPDLGPDPNFALPSGGEGGATRVDFEQFQDMLSGQGGSGDGVLLDPEPDAPRPSRPHLP